MSQGCERAEPVKQDCDVLKETTSEFQDFCHPEQLLVGVDRIKEVLASPFQKFPSTVGHRCSLICQFIKTQL